MKDFLKEKETRLEVKRSEVMQVSREEKEQKVEKRGSNKAELKQKIKQLADIDDNKAKAKSVQRIDKPSADNIREKQTELVSSEKKKSLEVDLNFSNYPPKFKPLVLLLVMLVKSAKSINVIS